MLSDSDLFKVKFSKEQMNTLSSNLLTMLLGNKTIKTKLGQPLNVVELLHTTTIGTLKSIKDSLAKKIEALEKDEWQIEDTIELQELRKDKETVNLIIGYKLKVEELYALQKKKEQLETIVSEMEDAAKTPEEKLKEVKSELDSLKAAGI